MMRVKICGITNREDAHAACEAGADALGFVFAPEAKARNRYIDPEKARLIIKSLPPWIATVAVCVNESLESMNRFLEFMDYIQLCGNESPETCAALGMHAIKVFRAAPDFVPETMKQYPGKAWMLDAYVPGSHGGSGVPCDWKIAREATALGKPIILAGGLTPDNVADAIRNSHPYAVDVSGGVECAPGKKDHERIRLFIRNAKLPVP